jgi:hypothetical protein
MTVAIGAGVSIGAGWSIGGGSTPPPPSGTTYTQGVDYTGTGIHILGYGGSVNIDIEATDFYWTNPADYATFAALPSGTAISFVSGGITYTGTFTSAAIPTSANSVRFPTTVTAAPPLFPDPITSFTFY